MSAVKSPIAEAFAHHALKQIPKLLMLQDRIRIAQLTDALTVTFGSID